MPVSKPRDTCSGAKDPQGVKNVARGLERYAHVFCDPLVGPKPVGSMLVSSEKMQVSLKIPISPKSKAKPMATRIPPKRLRGASKYPLLKHPSTSD